MNDRTTNQPPKFALGTKQFRDKIFPSAADKFEVLSHGQSPEALFITCSDSRIDIAMITQSEPGSLFVSRNPGNIVPPYADRDESLSASIEYAVLALEVPHIVVCGHSGCGAMQGALNPASTESLEQVSHWLRHVEALATPLINNDELSDADRLQHLLERNVVQQLENLATYPTVAAQLDAGRMELHGWLYEIGSGAISAYDSTRDEFVSIDQRYALVD